MPQVASQTRQNLLDRLEDLQVISASEQARVRKLAAREGMTVVRAILKLGLVEERKILRIAAQALGLDFVEAVDSNLVDEKRLGTLTQDYCKARFAFPARSLEGESSLVLSDPTDHELIAELSFFLDAEPEIAVATQRDIHAALVKINSGEKADGTVDVEQTFTQDEEFLRQESMDGPAIRFVAGLLQEAVHRKASDIHVESTASGLHFRYRVAGLLEPETAEQNLSPSSVLARIKVLAGLNVSERRLPQDGRITNTVAGRKIDFRVSTIPTSFGESIVLRVLDPNALALGWDKLGFEPKMTKQIIQTIERPSGLFLVTGPTGSGKTTTLYTALSHLADEKVKIVTVEDPVEYVLPGVQQVQVNEHIGMTFSKALRSFLRQDPNIIMVGEIRDEETAEIACRAALVGRLVLSTLHTRSPQGAYARLQDLGIPKYLVDDVLIGVLGQELRIGETGKREMVATTFFPGEGTG